MQHRRSQSFKQGTYTRFTPLHSLGNFPEIFECGSTEKPYYPSLKRKHDSTGSSQYLGGSSCKRWCPAILHHSEQGADVAADTSPCPWGQRRRSRGRTWERKEGGSSIRKNHRNKQSESLAMERGDIVLSITEVGSDSDNPSSASSLNLSPTFSKTPSSEVGYFCTEYQYVGGVKGISESIYTDSIVLDQANRFSTTQQAMKITRLLEGDECLYCTKKGCPGC
jgi:hypothetical protein